MATGLKKLLVISWSMPPMLFPRSIQVSRVLAGLAQRGWQTTVICADPRAVPNIDNSLEKLYSHHFETVRVPNARPAASLPDPLMSQWLEPALSAARDLLAGQHFSAIVTFAQPWVDHLIGLELNKLTQLPWVAHFSDPWVDSPYYEAIEPNKLVIWQEMERNVVHTADLVLFTNAQALELIMNKYPSEWRHKTHVIPHAFDPALTGNFQASPPPRDRLRLVYTGDLYGKRSPRALLQALAQLKKTGSLKNEIEVWFWGHVTPEDRQLAGKLKIKNLVHFQDQVPYLESLRAAAEAGVLLLLDASSSTPSAFLPSKLIDYLMFKKLILGLTPDEGASADLLRRLGCLVVPPDDVPAIAEALSDLLMRWKSGNLSVSPQFEQVGSEYEMQETARSFDQQLMSVIGKGVEL